MAQCRAWASVTVPATPPILYGCTDWVRNEWDGSVSMEIQGEESAINNVIRAIERSTYVQIENMDVKTIPLVEHEYGFRTK